MPPPAGQEAGDRVRMENPLDAAEEGGGGGGGGADAKSDKKLGAGDGEGTGATSPGKWGSHTTGKKKDRPDILVNGEITKVSKRDHGKWNETGLSALDDQAFQKLDQDLCASLARSPSPPHAPAPARSRASD